MHQPDQLWRAVDASPEEDRATSAVATEPLFEPDDRQLHVVRAERQLIRLSLADLTAASRDSSIRLGGTQFPLDPVEQPRGTRRR